MLYKNGHVIQMVITSVISIVIRQKYYIYTEDILAILLVFFYRPLGPRHPPVNFIYIMAYF